jgi:nucleoside-diphosphate-sugar epimerase
VGYVGEKVLVTGAGGFIGSRVVDQLLSDRMDVRCLVRRTPFRTPRSSRDVVVGDVRDPSVAAEATKRVDTVFHFAAAVHRRATEDEYRSINVEGTRNIARAAGANNVRHFVFASSTSVYGKGGVSFKEESPCRPDNAYGQSKLMAEKAAADVAAETGMRLTILRLSTVYGEGEPGNVSRLIKAVAKHGPLVLGKGANRKSMTYVDNVAALCSRLARWPGPSGVSILNVADPEPYRLDEIVAAIASALNKPRHLVRVDRRLALVGSWCLTVAARLLGRKSPLTPEQVVKITEDAVCDVTRLRQEVGFVAPILLEEGIRKTVDWYRSKGET